MKPLFKNKKYNQGSPFKINKNSAINGSPGKRLQIKYQSFKNGDIYIDVKYYIIKYNKISVVTSYIY